MSSGKRVSVLLFCTSPIDKLYLAPIDYYEPDIIHIFISDRGDVMSAIERKVFESSKKAITCKKVYEHKMDTADYEDVLGIIIDIKKDLHSIYGDDVDIFINISSGTPEFSAAGMFASMLPHPASAFRVGTEYEMDAEKMSSVISDLSGSVKVSEPERVTGLKNDRPEDEMVSFLTVVHDLLKETKYPKYRTIIERLKSEESWSYDPDKKSGYGRTPLDEREERYLKRHYIATALENGWLERPSPNTMRLTDSGKAYISVYGNDERTSKVHAGLAPICYSSESVESGNMSFMAKEDQLDYYRPTESLRASFNLRKRKYSFTIDMDRHR